MSGADRLEEAGSTLTRTPRRLTGADRPGPASNWKLFPIAAVSSPDDRHRFVQGPRAIAFATSVGVGVRIGLNPSPSEAIELICLQLNVESIVFDASNAGNIRGPRKLVEERWRL